jgi:transcriptional regulator with XRE-family HTH domain
MRLRRTMSQRELADLAGTKQAAISRIERGLVSPSVETLERIVGAMGERLVVTTTPRDPVAGSPPVSLDARAGRGAPRSSAG